MPDAANEPAPAEVAYTGTWRLEPRESNESNTFALRYAPSASNCSGPIVLTKLGLTTEALGGQEHALRFELRREAGTFECHGTAGDRRGNGVFRFRPDPLYAKAIAETGLPPLTLHQNIQAGMFDIPSSFVKAIVATGLQHVTFRELLRLRIFRITAENVSAFCAYFQTATLDDISALAMTGVTAGYLEALRRANVGDLSADNVSALRASGIDQAFIESLAANGRHGLSIDDVVSLHDRGS